MPRDNQVSNFHSTKKSSRFGVGSRFLKDRPHSKYLGPGTYSHTASEQERTRQNHAPDLEKITGRGTLASTLGFQPDLVTIMYIHDIESKEKNELNII